MPKNLKSYISEFSSGSFCILILCYILIAGNVNSANGHIAAFVNSDGKPNINPRQIRGPESIPFIPSSGHSIIRQQEGSRGKQWALINNPTLANKGVTTSEINDSLNFRNNGELLDFDDKATFVPFIGPRALSNIPEFLQHVKDNLEALQFEEDELDDYYDYENSLLNSDTYKHHNRRESERPILRHPTVKSSSEEKPFFDRLASRPRWQPIAAGVDGHPHSQNTRSFVEPPSFQESFMRRSSNYNPSWSYTKLGLGRRRKR